MSPSVSEVTRFGVYAVTRLHTAFPHTRYRKPPLNTQCPSDALLCSEGPVQTLVALSEVPEHRRGYGALYDAVHQGRPCEKQLRGALLAAPLPRDATGRIVLAVYISSWLRTDAPTSSERLFCHTYARGSGAKQMIPVGRIPSSPRWNPDEPLGPGSWTCAGWVPPSRNPR